MFWEFRYNQTRQILVEASSIRAAWAAALKELTDEELESGTLVFIQASFV